MALGQSPYKVALTQRMLGAPFGAFEGSWAEAVRRPVDRHFSLTGESLVTHRSSLNLALDCYEGSKAEIDTWRPDQADPDILPQQLRRDALQYSPLQFRELGRTIVRGINSKRIGSGGKQLRRTNWGTTAEDIYMGWQVMCRFDALVVHLKNAGYFGHHYRVVTKDMQTSPLPEDAREYLDLFPPVDEALPTESTLTQLAAELGRDAKHLQASVRRRRLRRVVRLNTRKVETEFYNRADFDLPPVATP